MTPLQGITVLDLTRVLSGPYCTMLLSDMGARVIKVEQPGKGDDTRGWGPPFLDGESAYFLSINRNKESVALDFKHPAGREVLERLIAKADVLVENFRPGTLARLGFDYATVSQRHPRLIYCSISGFGEEGPFRNSGCSDPIMQAYSGFARLNGAPGESLDAFRFTGFLDLSTAATAVQSILAALIDRERTEAGQEVRVSMIEAALEMQCTRVAEWLGSGELAIPRGTAGAAFAPDRAYQSADYEIFVSVCRDAEWSEFCRAIEQPDLAGDERFSTNPRRVQNRAALDELVAPLIAQKPALWWVRAFSKHGIAAGLAHTFEQFRFHRQIAENDMLAEIDTPWGEVTVAGMPWHFSQTRCTVTSAPVPDQHTTEILETLPEARTPETMASDVVAS